MLITLIAYLALLSIVILIFSHDCSDYLACMDTLLYTVWFDILIHLLVYYLNHFRAWCLYHFSSDCHSLYVNLSNISCTLLDCMLLVHVGLTSIPLPPTLLVSVIPFIPVLTIASVRPCVCLLLWPSQRLGVRSNDGLYWCLGAFWRWLTLWCRLEFDHWRPV